MFYATISFNINKLLLTIHPELCYSNPYRFDRSIPLVDARNGPLVLLRLHRLNFLSVSFFSPDASDDSLYLVPKSMICETTTTINSVRFYINCLLICRTFSNYQGHCLPKIPFPIDYLVRPNSIGSDRLDFFDVYEVLVL